MANKFVQWACIKFSVKLGKSAAKTLRVLCEAFKEKFSSHCNFEWSGYAYIIRFNSLAMLHSYANPCKACIAVICI